MGFINKGGTKSVVVQEVYEIENHLHSCERWFGDAVTPAGETHIADRLGPGVDPFQIDAGNNNWGNWFQVVGSADLPTDGYLYFDFHRVFITDNQRTGVHFIQISFGATGAAGFAAGNYTEFVYKPQAVNTSGSPIKIQADRRAAGMKAWARVMVPGQVSGTLDFYFGVHEYVK